VGLSLVNSCTLKEASANKSMKAATA